MTRFRTSLHPCVFPTTYEPFHRWNRERINTCEDFGGYISEELFPRWLTRRQTSAGADFMVRGNGEHPHEPELWLWRTLHPRLDEFVSIALQQIDPSANEHEEMDGFNANDLLLSEIRLEDDNRFLIFLGSDFCDEANVWPMVTFENFTLASIEWVK